MSKRITEMIDKGSIAELRAALRSNPMLIHAKNDEGDTLLHLACWKKKLDMVDELLSYGARVNERGHRGRTPLHYAVYAGDVRSTPIVRRLLEAGAQPDVCDDNGFDVGEWAVRERPDYSDGLVELLMLLVDHKRGATVETPRPAPEPIPLADAFRAPEPAKGSAPQTEVALAQLIAAFKRGSEMKIDAIVATFGQADESALREAHRILKVIEKSPWASAVRAWMKKDLKHEHLHRLVEGWFQKR